jgi:hypothetical protein
MAEALPFGTNPSSAVANVRIAEKRIRGGTRRT